MILSLINVGGSVSDELLGSRLFDVSRYDSRINHHTWITSVTRDGPLVTCESRNVSLWTFLADGQVSIRSGEVTLKHATLSEPSLQSYGLFDKDCVLLWSKLGDDIIFVWVFDEHQSFVLFWDDSTGVSVDAYSYIRVRIWLLVQQRNPLVLKSTHTISSGWIVLIQVCSRNDLVQLLRAIFLWIKDATIAGPVLYIIGHSCVILRWAHQQVRIVEVCLATVHHDAFDQILLLLWVHNFKFLFWFKFDELTLNPVIEDCLFVHSSQITFVDFTVCINWAFSI